MAIKTGFITEEHPISSLSSKFTLNGKGFRIYLEKKTANDADILSVKGKLYGSDTEVTVPVNTNTWSDQIFKEIAATGIVLTNHNLYFGVKDPIRYSVHFNCGRGKFVKDDARIPTFDQQVQWGTKATEPTTDPTLYDYTFDDWYIGENKFNFDTLIYEDTTITAIYNQNLTVTFDSAGGTAVAAEDLLSGETATEPTDPTRAGYTFVKWLIGAVEYEFATPVTSDITLTADWSKNLIATFNSAGGSAVEPQEVENGAVVTEPTDPTKSGYTFNKWMLGEVEFNFAVPIIADVTITATWLENFTVTFNSDGGTAVAAQEIADGSIATAPDPAPTKAGYNFVKWMLDVVTYNFATPVTADITLTAEWVELFDVTFDSQGGTAVTAQSVANGSLATLPDPAPTKEANTLLYWSLAAEGTEFAFTTPITADTTLYAIWDPS